MSDASSRAQQRLSELIEVGEELRAGITPRDGAQASIPAGDLWKFLVCSLQAVKVVCGECSPHYEELKHRRDLFENGSPLRLHECIGILEAAADDLSFGMLSGLRELVVAEVFDDLLEMAKHLQESGFFLASVALAGGVLEDALRKLHAKHLPDLPVPEQISPLNDALRQNGIYSQPQWREVQAWCDLRNASDHLRLSNSASLRVTDEQGNPQPDIDPQQVARMIEGVRAFIVKHLT